MSHENDGLCLLVEGILNSVERGSDTVIVCDDSVF